MRTYLHICDICKKEVIDKNYKPNDWKAIELKYGQYNSRDFDICPECLPKLGIPVDEKGTNSVGNKDVSDRLFEIIEEIIQEKLNQM